MTSEQLVNLDFDIEETKNILPINNNNNNNSLLQHHYNHQQQKKNNSYSPNKKKLEDLIDIEIDRPVLELSFDDKHSIISLTSSTEDICLVPDVSFEGINLDSPSGIGIGESQPLLGGGQRSGNSGNGINEHSHHHQDITYNQFPGV